MARKPKKEPMSETRREYCRDLYAVAAALHARNLDEAATAQDVLRVVFTWGAWPTREFFDRITEAAHVVMERRAGKRVDIDDARSFMHHMNLDILSRFVPVAADTRGFFTYLQNVQGSGEWWSDEAFASLLAALDGLKALREADPPTFASVVAKDDERVAKLAASREVSA